MTHFWRLSCCLFPATCLPPQMAGRCGPVTKKNAPLQKNGNRDSLSNPCLNPLTNPSKKNPLGTKVKRDLWDKEPLTPPSKKTSFSKLRGARAEFRAKPSWTPHPWAPSHLDSPDRPPLYRPLFGLRPPQFHFSSLSPFAIFFSLGGSSR